MEKKHNIVFLVFVWIDPDAMEMHSVYMKIPPHPDPLPRWGEGKKKSVIARSRVVLTRRRENPILSVYHHPSFPNATLPSFPNAHPSVIPECLYRESMPFQLPLDP